MAAPKKIPAALKAAADAKSLVQDKLPKSLPKVLSKDDKKELVNEKINLLAEEGKQIWVKAKSVGIYPNGRRRVRGEEFVIAEPVAFSHEWMELKD